MKTIFLIPCPIADGTQDQVLPLEIGEAIKKIDVYFVENVRSARRFISSMKTGKVIEDLTFYVVDKKTRQQQIEQYLKESSQKNIGVISEAGCPGVADPGALIVSIAHEKGYEVKPLVGPSSILLALMGSGFNGQHFTFNGYLAIDKTKRKKQLKELERQVSSGTQIFMETPFRNNQLLRDMLEVLHSHTKLCIASSVSSVEEFVKTKTVEEWKQSMPDLHKKPVIFLLGN